MKELFIVKFLNSVMVTFIVVVLGFLIGTKIYVKTFPWWIRFQFRFGCFKVIYQGTRKHFPIWQSLKYSLKILRLINITKTEDLIIELFKEKK